MPVTAKRSHKFYETVGDDIANELVEWFKMQIQLVRQTSWQSGREH